MNDLKTQQSYYEQQRILAQLNLLDPKLYADHARRLIQYQQHLAKRYARSQDPKGSYLQQKIEVVMKLLKQAHPEVSFMFVVKKCVFLHVFLHLAAKRGEIGQQLASIGHKIALQIANQLIPAVGGTQSTAVKKPQKRESSLSKVVKAVRSLSGSTSKSLSKIAIQEGKQKGAIREIMAKIMTPLASYLLKISQDYEVYSQLLTRRVDQTQMQTLKWKISNYLLQLSLISVEFNRLGKYYQQDMLGPWVIINYILSTDIAIYYDMVISDLHRRSQKWKDSVALAVKMSKISKKHKSSLQSLLKEQALLQLKSEIQLVSQIKQNLFYIYYNIQTQKYSWIMQPPFAAGQKNMKMEPIEYLMDVFEQANINSSVRQLRKKESEGSSSRIDFKTPRKGDLTRSLKKEVVKERITLVKVKEEQRGDKEEKGDKEEETPKTMLSFKKTERAQVRGNGFIQSIKQRTIGSLIN